MAVERVFGCLKGRWKILLKRIDVPLQNLLDLVTACICLHNLCIIYGDGFNLRKFSNQNLGDLKNDEQDATSLLIAI